MIPKYVLDLAMLMVECFLLFSEQCSYSPFSVLWFICIKLKAYTQHSLML